MKYENRTLYANIECVTWCSLNMGKLVDFIGENASQLPKYINTDLSFYNFGETELREVFDVHWLNSDCKSKSADKVELYDVEFGSNCVTLSLNLWWYNVPISVEVSSERNLDHFFEYPWDLLDSIFLNEEAVGVTNDSEVDEVEESSCGSRGIWVLDADEESLIPLRKEGPKYANEEFSDLSLMLTQDDQNPTYKRELLSPEKLDFSLESLRHIDEYLEHIRKHPPEGDDFLRLVLRCGAYVGEVMRKHSNKLLHWVSYEEAAEHFESARKLEYTVASAGILFHEPETMSFPLGKVCKVIENGKEDSVYSFAKVLLELDAGKIDAL